MPPGRHDDAPTPPHAAGMATGGVGDVEMQIAMRAVLAGMLGRIRDVQIGRYVVRKRLGHGGCGLVLLAEDPELDREVAIKVVLPVRDREGGSATWQKALQREAQSLARLKHPNVVEVYDAGTTEYGHESDGRARVGVFLVMERLRGVTLRQWLEQSPRSWQEIVDAHLQAGAGLAAAHEAGIVHRDFKPENVLLTRDGRVVLIDFGLADLEHLLADGAADVTGELLDESSPGGDAHTRESRVVGTPTYMAPEQHMGHVAGPAADQYAFAVSLFAALFGAPPFESASLSSLARAKARGVLPSTRAAQCRGVPQAIWRALARALQPEPSARHASLAALLQRLQQARTPRRRWPLVAATAACVPALLLLGSGRARHPCDEPGEALPWRDEARAGVLASLAALPDANAGAMSQRVGDRLDAHTRRWQEAHERACAAPVSSKLTAQLSCLERSSAQTGAVIESLGEVGLEELGHVGRVLDDLSPPSRCLELDGDVRTPALREELAELWRKTDALGVEVLATGTTTSMPWAQTAFARAEELGEGSLASMLAWRISQVERAAGRLESGESWLRTAVFRAAAAGDHARALELMPMLVLTVGSDLAQHDAAQRLVEHAKVMAQQVEDPRKALAVLDASWAYILIESGDPDGAKQYYDRAMAQFDALGEPSEDAARCMLSLAGWAVEHGDHEQALALLGRAEEMLAQVAMPTDLIYATIEFLEAGIAEDREDLEGAAAGYRNVVARVRARLHGHPFLGVALDAVARAEARLGRMDEATSLAIEARDLSREAHGPVHADTIRYEILVGHVAWLGGHMAEAAAATERALASLAELPERAGEFVTGARHLAAWAYVGLGDLEQAQTQLTLMRETPGPGDSNVDLPRSLRRLEAAIALGRGDRDGVERALAQVITTAVQAPHDEALEQRLDAVLRTAADGGAAIESDDGALRRDRVLYLHAFARALAGARGGRGT
ncbi:MAG: serine/threonine-protein kinase [Nannocystaceae bacterium]|nr:serine/threonine-protein kinase [Nannocystaceae bacterium]